MVLLEYSFVSYYFTRRTFDCIHLRKKKFLTNQEQKNNFVSALSTYKHGVKFVKNKFAKNFLLTKLNNQSNNIDKNTNCLEFLKVFFLNCFNKLLKFIKFF